VQLTDIQKSILLDDTRFKILVAGRRFSKTFIAINSLAKHARHPGKKCMYVAPSYRMARQIAWEDCKSMLRERNWIKKINESNLEITLVNGSMIMMRSADNKDSIRGIGLDYVVIDEAADIPGLQETWQAVIRPTLSDREGDAMIIGTPKGKGFLFDLFNTGKTTEDWISWQYTTAQGGQVSEEELAQAKRDLDDRTFKQEYEAGWIEFAGSIYYSFGDHNLISKSVPLQQGTPIQIGMDFNVSPICAVLAYKTMAGLHVFDEIEIYGSDTQEMCNEIRQRYPDQRFIAYPDASGARRQTSSGGLSDHIIIQNAGFKLVCGSRNPPVKDRIASVNSVLKQDNIRLTIDPKCAKVINGLRKHTYKEGTRQPEKEGATDFSHFNDALGYLVYANYPVRPEYKHVGAKPTRTL
jgi:hypothetical protein